MWAAGALLGTLREVRWYLQSPSLAQQVVRREGPRSGTNLSAPEKEAGPPPESHGEGGWALG